MLRRPNVSQLGWSVLAVTALLAVGTVAVASLPPRPLRSVLTVIHAVSLRVATYWVVVVALLSVIDRLANAEAVVDEPRLRHLSAVVFVAVVAIEASPLVRLIVEPATSVEAARVFDRALGAIRAALFPAGLFLGTGLATLRLRDATASERETSALPLAPREGLTHPDTPRALWEMGRVLALATALYVALDVVAALVITPYPYVVLVFVEAGVGALDALFDHLVVGIALFALLARGVTGRSLAAVAVAVLASTFLLGVARAIVGALLGVAVVSVTVTPIPAIENADLVNWPDPLAWHALVLVGSVVAAGVGFWTIQGLLSRDRRPSQRDASVGTGTEE